jgi:peptidoglycan hydrolase-like protein with peptidoglycan-binding domain
MIKRTLLTVGLSAMLAMPVLATGSGSGPSGSASGMRMEHGGQREMGQQVGMEQIRMAQKHLKEAGFDPGPIDGQLGQKTAQAIREYQKSNGLPATGRLDEPTKDLLLTQRTEPSPSRMEPSPGFGSGGSRPGEPMPGSRSPSGASPGGGMSPSGSTGAGR